MEEQSVTVNVVQLGEQHFSISQKSCFSVRRANKGFSEEEVRSMNSTHSFSLYCIFYITNGSGNCCIDNHVFDVESNSIIFIPPHSIVDSRMAHVEDGIMLLFSEGLFSSCNEGLTLYLKSILFASYHRHTAHRLSESTGNKCLTYFEALFDEEQENKPFKNEIAMSIITQIIFTAAREIELKLITIDTNSSICLRFAEMINENFRKEHRAGYYAENLGVDVKTLSKHCQMMFHTSPHDLIAQRILFEAKKLLSHSIMEIKEISYYLGFSDHTYFHKFFKQHAGLSPAEYRKEFWEAIKQKDLIPNIIAIHYLCHIVY